MTGTGSFSGPLFLSFIPRPPKPATTDRTGGVAAR